MMEEFAQKLCRVYTIRCPACSNQNRFPRLKRDIHRVREQEPDGHPLVVAWLEKSEYPEWLTPLNFFWGSCERCFYTAQLDDADFRQWEKTSNKYLGQYSEGALDDISTKSDTSRGVMQALGRGIKSDDPFGTPLAQFFLGVFSECLKTAPLAGNLGRFYLRIAWLYRDEARLYPQLAAESKIRDLLEEVAPAWTAELPPNSNFPVPPEVVTGEVEALRFAMAYFEWNFRSLAQAGHEDEMRLMTLISEIAYRIYELTGLEEDFVKARSGLSGTMQKCQSIIGDKTIVGGVVNRAKDVLGKTGDRGRELRALKQRRDKGLEDIPAAASAPKPAPPPQPAAEESAEAEPAEAEPVEAEPAETVEVPAVSGDVQALQQKVSQLDEENKRWMRLAGMSELTGLPNRVMVFRVLLPGALKQALAKREPLGCILVSPNGLSEINGKHGRPKGDLLIKQFSECLKGLLKRGERLSHLEGVNFALLVPTMPLHQLRKRAELLHKDLTSRRFDVNGEVFSLKVTIGVAGLDNLTGNSAKVLQEALYTQALTALDSAKLKSSQIEVYENRTPSQ